MKDAVKERAMKYPVRVWTAMHGDAVPLIYVAEAMARYAASGYGDLPVHAQTLAELRPNRQVQLLDAAKAGHLKVCDSQGRVAPVGEIISAAEIPTSAQDDFVLSALHAKTKHIIEWGAANGDEFEFVETPGEVVEFDLTNQSGEVLKAGYYRGTVGGGESEPLATVTSREAPIQVVLEKPDGSSYGAVLASPDPAAVEQQQKKRRTWQEITWPYLESTFKAGRYGTAKEFFKELENKAGAPSPFDKGTGTNRGTLFVRETSQSISFKTIQNQIWPKLKSPA